LRGARFALLLDSVPFIGPVLAAIPAVMLALATSPSQALYVAGTYLGVQSAKAMCSRHHRAA
jgi:predicted PurR-regulated permease PerM